jgi:hypothetical protein
LTKCGLGSREFDLEVLEAEVQLVVIQPFGAPAKLAALQLLDDEMKPFDLSLARTTERGGHGENASVGGPGPNNLLHCEHAAPCMR